MKLRGRETHFRIEGDREDDLTSLPVSLSCYFLLSHNATDALRLFAYFGCFFYFYLHYLCFSTTFDASLQSSPSNPLD